MDPNAYFLFRDISTGNSLKSLMCFTQTFAVHLLCYIYQATQCVCVCVCVYVCACVCVRVLGGGGEFRPKDLKVTNTYLSS